METDLKGGGTCGLCTGKQQVETLEDVSNYVEKKLSETQTGGDFMEVVDVLDKRWKDFLVMRTGERVCYNTKGATTKTNGRIKKIIDWIVDQGFKTSDFIITNNRVRFWLFNGTNGYENNAIKATKEASTFLHALSIHHGVTYATLVQEESDVLDDLYYWYFIFDVDDTPRKERKDKNQKHATRNSELD